MAHSGLGCHRMRPPRIRLDLATELTHEHAEDLDVVAVPVAPDMLEQQSMRQQTPAPQRTLPFR
jgi:hypothetical protein